METKNNRRDKLRGGKHEPKPEANTTGGGKADVSKPIDDAQGPATIRKGIYLSALIYIESKQAPADNFNALAKAALNDRLAGKNSPEYAGLTMTVKKVEEVTDGEGDGGKGKGGDKGGKFEF